jgi:tRNA pseudouridine13 synthase
MTPPPLPDPLLQAPLRLTVDLPGTGGVIKQEVEDFVVEEIPAYLPSGEGEHLYLWIEKRGMGAEYFVRQLGQRLGISPRDIGTAGMKDRRAVTRQWVSLPATCEPLLNQLEGDGVAVLKVDRHGNKLRPGHLHGNRFTILIRNVAEAETLIPILTRIQEQGLPNYYGEQRFGRGNETLQIGWTLLHGGRVNVGHFLRKLALSAVQSAIFNVYLSDRLRDGHFRSVLDGDVMAKWPAGGMFVTSDPVTEQVRFANSEIVHTGPMFGTKMREAERAAGEREAKLLESLGVSRETFRAGGKLLEGTRRHNVVYVNDLNWSQEQNNVRLQFTLPAGSYATVLLGEVMKTPAAAGDD